jgi:3'(2'), 5'-bisphosphate nucleotidase
MINDFLPIAIHAAELASKDILSVYHSSDFEVEAKGDQSPLTIADKKAHETISHILKSTGLPILSEEGKTISYDERKSWEYFWMVDPLDGTKEFIKRNGDFTVNVALIHKTKPVLGVIVVPVSGEVFYAVHGEGAWSKKNGEVQKLSKRGAVDLSTPGLRVVASKSHMNPETEEFIFKLKEPILVSRGSSLKFMLLAEGKADVYPRFAPTMEWDTAAAQTIVTEVGLKVLQINMKQELAYNKQDLLNPYFLVL